ncbi:hypothetical protein MBH78_06695 [Oceanimonas sp. NS1]|nr:hypothetical protein [Oceanimonas sp. NS1]
MKMLKDLTLRLWLVAGLLIPALPAAAQVDNGQALLEALDVRAFDAKGQAIDAIINSGDARARDWLAALLDGRLQRSKADRRFVLVVSTDGRHWPVLDALSNDSLGTLGTLGRRELNRISINNRLRNQLRNAPALLDLHGDDAALRRASAERLLGGVDDGLVPTLTALLAQESDRQTRHRLNQALAIHRLEQGTLPPLRR